MEKLPVSAVIIAKNEEDNMADCLKSVLWADEIIVLDDCSTDETVNIARRFTDKVFSRKMEVEGAHRNYAYSLARNDWVMSLDADERVSEELREELKGLFNKPPQDKGYTIPVKTYLGKRWIRYGGWYPSARVKLFDKRFFRYDEVEVHPRGFLLGNCGHLKKDIIHYSYGNFHDFFKTLNNQTTLEAKKWFNEKRRIGFLKMYRKFVDRLLKAYFVKQGWREGFLGFMLAYASGLYQLMSYVKYQEMLEDHGSNIRQETAHGAPIQARPPVPVSIVIITKNEEKVIGRCLESVKWADEIIVLDDCSTDETVNIARRFTDKVFSRKMEVEGAHRNYAYSLARNDWVMSLDADEVVSAELADEIRVFLRRPPKRRAYTIPIKTFLGKKWIRHCGWYPAAKVRLFDRRFFRYEEVEVHPRVFIRGRCGHLKKDILHYSYKDLHDYFESMNNQTTLEAKKWFNEKRRIGFLSLYRKFIHRFLKSYVLKEGFLDGRLGFIFSYGGGLYQIMSYVKYWEMLKNQNE